MTLDAVREGDVLITAEHHTALTGEPRTVRYCVSISPWPAEILCGTYEEAVQRGTEMAQERGVDLWHTQDGHSWNRLAAHRAAP